MSYAHLIRPFDVSLHNRDDLSGMFVGVRDRPYTEALDLFPSTIFGKASSRNWSVVCGAYEAVIERPCRAFIQMDQDFHVVHSLPREAPIQWRPTPGGDPGLDFYVSDLPAWGEFLGGRLSTALDHVAVVGEDIDFSDATGRALCELRFDATNLRINVPDCDLAKLLEDGALLIVMSVFFNELADPFIFGSHALIEAVEQRLGDTCEIVELPCSPRDITEMHRD